ncbi:HAMP domain-containing protein [Ornithinibacillus sp. L9]|uniref:HAMP domain-containing protein n=1 Tax=Ornithinibacillus caprae TaxID=2678566 RepID=A0A6N8FL14_9BACI|nr:methyl-accepting chemotaxis protein [Ornithinibacillus caprae]MUK89044.1 HAMP domain-containing protein [Ornithinibacillus caprae]
MKLKGKGNKISFNFFNKSIRNQILFPFILLIIFAGVVVSVVSYNYSVKTTTDELTNSVEGQMANMNDTFELFFRNIDNTLDLFISKDLLIQYDPENRDEVIQNLGEAKESNTSILNIYTGIDQSGDMIVFPVADLGDDFNVKDRPWYQDAVAANGDTVWTEPYEDTATGEMVITAAKAYYNNNNLIGVIGIDVTITTLLEMIEGVEIGETGYAVLMDQAGSYIAHPDSEYIGKDESETDYYIEIQESGDQGIVDYHLDGEDKVMGFAKNTTTGWIIGGTVYVNEFEQKARSILLPISISLGVVILLAVIASIFITNRITTPIKKLQVTMKEVENGNLVAHVDTNRKDEVGQLSVSFKNMLDQMRNMMQKVSTISYSVSEASQTLVASAEENTASANEVATTMEQIASGAADQSELMEESSAAASGLSEMIKQIEAQNNKLYEESISMKEASEEGATIIAELRDQSIKTGKMTKEMVQAINSLDNRSTNINKIVEKITDVANQTNLLALNAAIEAARAGENGRGFAVVADEVRKLAEQTEHALGDISGLISEMQEEMKSTVTLITNTDEVIQTQEQSVNKTGNAFNSISDTIKTNNELIKNVMGLMEKMIEQEKKITANIMNNASISQETAAGTEEVSASIEEQTASMEHLNNLATELESYSIQMQEEIERFVITKQ